MTAPQEQAQSAVIQLVEKFRQSSVRQRAAFTEQQTREYFILPLFRALGWNTENPAEFSAEEQISRGFVDFGFYLNGVPAFFLETKRAAEKLEDPRHMQQAINYAYLKGVTWAVLTDFEELKVFNAEVLESDPQKAIFLDLQWESYANGRFEDLWLLSKDSFGSGAINALAERFGKKQRKRPVTEQLFAQLTQWRRELFKEIRGWDPTLWSNDPRAVDNAVQRLLDRLIFIRTVEDRGIEANRLRALVRQYEDSRKKGKNLFHELQALFRELDAVYNARLFAESTVDHVQVHNPDLLTSIVNGLYDVPGGFITYDFNAIDADVLGSIYEQYLGFKAQDPRGEDAVDLDKRQKRKAQGIYYTPQFVVRYIVQNTLGRLLEEVADPHRLRILDPACGSGSFLIEAFDVLDRWLAQHGTEEDKQFPRRRRLRILRENLYGVDLDEQAVEVARLNLLLRAAGERGLLPMLDNIRRGNSLIDDLAVAGDAAFDWPREFPQVFAEGGFDVVIGNPPYIPIETMQDREKEYFQRTFRQLERKYDSSVIFILAMLDRLKPTGLLGYISSVTWQTGANYPKLREYLFSRFGISRLVNLPFDVFPDAYVDTGIYILSGSRKGFYEIYRFPKKEERPNLTDISYIRVEQDLLEAPDYKIILEPIAHRILLWARSQEEFVTLGEITISTQGLTASRFDRQPQQENAERYPFLEKGQVYRYAFEVERLTYVDLNDYPSLKPFYDAQPKILIRRIVNRSDRLMATYTDQRIVFTKDINPFVITDSNWNALYVLGVLNSRLISYLYVNTSSIATKDDFRQTTLTELRALPIPFLPESDPRHDRMVALVTQMLDLTQQHAAAEAAFDDRRHDLARWIAQVDADIDALVYELYGLTDAEIAIVEGRA